MTLEIWTDITDGIERAALTDGRKLLDLALAPVARIDQPGAIFPARLLRRDGKGGFVELAAASGAPAIKAYVKKLAGEDIGQTFPIQILRPARQGAGGEKLALAGTDLLLPGYWLIYHPRGSGVGCSKRTRLDAAAQAALKAALAEKNAPGGWTLRHTAQVDQVAAILEEAAHLLAAWRTAEAAPSPYPAPPPAFRLIAQAKEAVPKIIAESDDHAQALGHWQARTGHGWSGGIIANPERGAPLFERAGFADIIDKLHAPLVSLPGGGTLVIEATEAMTVIDVNTGAAGIHARDKVQREALAEIARQIRLRNSGGTIVIDSLSPQDLPARRKLLAECRAIMADDPAGIDVFGISRLGLIELTRKKLGWSLAEINEAKT